MSHTFILAIADCIHLDRGFKFSQLEMSECLLFRTNYAFSFSHSVFRDCPCDALVTLLSRRYREACSVEFFGCHVSYNGRGEHKARATTEGEEVEGVESSAMHYISIVSQEILQTNHYNIVSM